MVFDVGKLGVASTVLVWLAAGRVWDLWSGTPSLNSVQRNSQALHVGRYLGACAALGIPAGEHSPYDSVFWKRPLRSWLMQRWSFSHVVFCAGGGRFRKRTGMIFIHCGTPSYRSLHCRSAHRVCIFTGLPHHHLEKLQTK